MGFTTRHAQNTLFLEYDKEGLDSSDLTRSLEEIKSRISGVTRIELDLRAVRKTDSCAPKALALFCKAFQRLSMEVAIHLTSEMASGLDLPALSSCELDVDGRRPIGEPKQAPGFGKKMTVLFWALRDNVFDGLSKYSNFTMVSHETKRLHRTELTEDWHSGAFCRFSLPQQRGVICIAFSKPAFLGMMSGFFGTDQTEVTEETREGAAELLNAIIGKVRPVAAYHVEDLTLGPPAFMDDQDIREIKAKPQLSCMFQTEHGPFWLKLLPQDVTRSSP